MKHLLPLLTCCGLLLCMQACRTRPAVQTDASTPVETVRVVAVLPHDATCYTQGLYFDEGVFYESGGLYGQSSLRKVSVETGTVLHRTGMKPEIFAEGITRFGNRILMLTWREHTAFVFDRASFRFIRSMACPTEGWGVVFDGTDFIVSDGSSTLYRRDTATFAEKGRIYVTDHGTPVTSLNEMELIDGELWANVYQTDRIVRIDPADGRVKGWVDCSGLLQPSDRRPGTDVLNGIAYDAAGGRIFITGKCWPKLFEIKLAGQAGKQ